MAGSSIGQKELPDHEMANGESKRAMLIIENADFPETVGEQVLIQGKGSIKSDSPEVTAAVKDTVQRLEKIDGVTDIQSPLVRADRAQTVSEDGRSVVVNFTLPDADDDEEKLIA
jgi:RND superfamily putative drug exporter